ncbi:MAG: glutathione S-transferase family protein [Gaiellaceae bacterium]
MIHVYRIPFSTNVERVALALAYKGLAVEWIDVDPADRSPIAAVSGQELVPVLVDGSTTLHDSPAILRYLEEIAPDPPLYPAEPARYAEVEVFVEWFNRVWKRPPNELAEEIEKTRPDPALVEALEVELEGSLRLFEGLLSGRDFLFGDFGIADVIAFPFLKYATLWVDGDEEVFHKVLRDGLRLNGRYPGVEAWISRVDARPRA